MKEGKIFKNNRGQLTLFIIVAIVVVALVAMAYLFFPQVIVSFGAGTTNPNVFIQNCMEQQLRDTVKNVSLQGGSLNPENFILYQNQKIEYLCYNANFYLPCIMQQPLLKQHIEAEIKRGIKNQEDSCFNSLKDSFEKRGYTVNLARKETNVELLPSRVAVTFTNDLTLTKQGSERFEKINVVLNNNLYELTSIADSILNWEARYGDTETTTFMSYYKNLKVEKKLQSDGSTIYILTNRNSGDKFQFASRSVAWPSGIAV
jgi:uncharacterized protein (UPF0333 family)